MGDSVVVKKLLRKRGNAEALSWLQAGGAVVHRGLSELSNAQSIALVKRVYQWGAANVIAANIKINSPYESTGTLLVALPEDPSKRASLFEKINEDGAQRGWDPETDAGQSHLLMFFV